MADKIVVMHDGIVEQIGAPLELYDRPANLFVAGFIGSPAMNFLKGRDREGDGRFVSRRRHALPVGAAGRRPARPARHLRHAARASVRSAGGFPGEVDVVEPTGSETQVIVALGGTGRSSAFSASASGRPGRGDPPPPDPAARHLFDADTGARISPDGQGGGARGSGRAQERQHGQQGGCHREHDHAADLIGRRGRPRRRRPRAPRGVRAGRPRPTPRGGRQPAPAALVALRQGRRGAWIANTKKFTEATGVEVRIDKESWEDIRPKAAVAANVGSGPDMVMCWFDDPHQYPGQARRRDRSRRPISASIRRLVRRPEKYAAPATASSSPCRSPPSATRSATATARSRRPASRHPERHRRLPRALQGAEGQGPPAGLPARQGGRRRQQLRPLAALEPWRQDGRRGRQGRHQQPGDARGHRIRQGSTRPSSRAPRAGSTSTTTAPSSPARSR